MVPQFSRSVADIQAAIEAGIKRLFSMQTQSGGLSYWPGASDPLSFACLSAERDCVIALDATCDTPIGVLAEAIDGDAERLRIRAYAGAPDGSVWIRDEIEGGRDVGARLAERMLSAGAAAILAL